MTILATAVIFAFVMAAASAVWLLICNEITFSQRGKVIDAVYDGPNWASLSHDFREVSYGRHLWAVATFRKWRELYSPEIQEALK